MSHRCRCTSADGTYTYTSTRTSTRVNIYIIYTTRLTPLLQGLCSIDPITATAASSKLAPSAHPRTPTHPVASNGQRDIFFIFFFLALTSYSLPHPAALYPLRHRFPTLRNFYQTHRLRRRRRRHAYTTTTMRRRWRRVHAGKLYIYYDIIITCINAFLRVLCINILAGACNAGALAVRILFLFFLIKI